MAKVYAVSAGEYEDSSIIGIFDNLEKTEKFRASRNDSNEFVEEFTLNPKIAAKYFHYKVSFNLITDKIKVSLAWGDNPRRENCIKKDNIFLDFYVVAESEEKALELGKIEKDKFGDGKPFSFVYVVNYDKDFNVMGCTKERLIFKEAWCRKVLFETTAEDYRTLEVLASSEEEAIQKAQDQLK